MNYTLDDLDAFTLLVDKGKLEGTAYFELHPRELQEGLEFWLEGSLFVRDACFDFFARCFERANPFFDYFDFVQFDAAQIGALTSELSAFVETLSLSTSREAVFASYNPIWGKDIWDDIDTERLRRVVAGAGAGIAEFVRCSTAESGCLWVLGM
jgi:hypothetical protein